MTGGSRIERRGGVDMTADEFRDAGHQLVELIATFYEGLPERRTAPGEPARAIRALLEPSDLPEHGASASILLQQTAPLLFDHSLHNGHPRFMGYITSSAAPIGALADLLAAAVNPNVGAWDLSPVASEIEAQTVRWLGQLIGFDAGAGGLMVSGGNMANFLAFVAARRARAPWNIRAAGTYGDGRRLIAYASTQTHTWIQKAADVTGLGTDSIRWIKTDTQQRMKVGDLAHCIEHDRAAGHLPFVVVATAGNVSTGAVDPLPAIHEVAQRHGVWFHVDGAYGAPAAVLPEASEDLRGLSLADSVALDPHKWLYAPLEAACVLVRDQTHLLDAFSYNPPYYRFDTDGDAEPVRNYYELGLQNSRGFRALKVWLGLRQLGRSGLANSIRRDIALAAELFAAADAHEEIEACTHNLSIATFRYVPADLRPSGERADRYLDELNAALLSRLQLDGEVYVSNAVLDGRYVLRACIVNFRTTGADIAAVPEIVARVGRALDGAMRPADLR